MNLRDDAFVFLDINYDKLVVGWTMRWLFLGVLVFAFVVGELFSSNMQLLLMFPRYEVIDSIDDLSRFPRLTPVVIAERAGGQLLTAMKVEWHALVIY